MLFAVCVIAALGTAAIILRIVQAASSSDRARELEARPPDIDPDDRTAAHEAGHAILAWVSTKVTRITTVTVDDENGDGVVRFDRQPLTTEADLWDSIVIGLAGIAAEGTAFGRIRASGARRDLQRALGWAEELAARGDPMGSYPWSQPQALSTINVGDMFAERPSPLACAVLNKAFRHAKDVIAIRPDKFDALRAELREKRSLEPSEVEAILGPRPWVRA